MSGIDLMTGLYLLGAAIFGGVTGWLVRGRQSSQNLDKLGEEKRRWRIIKT
jgi:hypothetical protein